MIPQEPALPPDCPAALGYRWPAEWEPHAATWLAWPHNRDTWPGLLDRVTQQMGELARLIARFEQVHVLCGGACHAEAARHLRGVAQVELHGIETNDAWIRDYGPTFLNGPPANEAALVDWRYNAWGGKYPPFGRDNAVASAIAELTGRRRFASELILEGGAIEGNGDGTVLSTWSCLGSRSRNPAATRERVEQELAENLAAKRVLWLPCAELEGDDTDGHVDQLARFVAEDTVVAATAEGDAFHEQPLRRNRQFLESAGLAVQGLPLPPPVIREGRRLPASYCNFYLTDGAVIVPAFGDRRADEQAGGILGELFSDREIHSFPAVEFVVGLGAIHCLTQQQ